jgi:hypothetical protein
MINALIRLRWRLRRLTWPVYDCEQCVGQDVWQGCYCDYHGGVAPGVGPERWRVWLRKVVRQ